LDRIVWEVGVERIVRPVHKMEIVGLNVRRVEAERERGRWIVDCCEAVLLSSMADLFSLRTDGVLRGQS
jgi:hypothetical protein